MHFSAVHLEELSTGTVAHPNQWYLESRGEGGAGGAYKPNKDVKTSKAAIYSQSSGPSQESTQDSSQLDGQSQLELMDNSDLLDKMESSESQ